MDDRINCKKIEEIIGSISVLGHCPVLLISNVYFRDFDYWQFTLMVSSDVVQCDCSLWHY